MDEAFLTINYLNKKELFSFKLIILIFFFSEKFKNLPKEQIDCPVACRVVDFDTVISYSQFPSNLKADWYAVDKFKLTAGTLSETRKFVR